MARSIAGYNEEAKKGRDAAMTYCKAWQFEITKLSTTLVADFTSKKITQANYNKLRAELNKQTEDLNNCIGAINRQTQKL